MPGQSGEADGEADGDMRSQRTEWAFYATLLVLDREEPERRIDRMYR